MPSQPQIQTPVETFTSEKAADKNKASGQRKLRLFLCIFLKQLSEIGSKLKKKKKKKRFLIVLTKRKFLEANLPSGRCMKYARKVTSGCPLVGLHVRSRGKKKGGTKRWAAIHVANNQMHSQLPDSRAQDGAACWGDPHLGLPHVHCHSTWGHSQGGHWWDTNCLYRLNQGWEAQTGPGTSGSTAPKAPEKLF